MTFVSVNLYPICWVSAKLLKIGGERACSRVGLGSNFSESTWGWSFDSSRSPAHSLPMAFCLIMYGLRRCLLFEDSGGNLAFKI